MAKKMTILRKTGLLFMVAPLCYQKLFTGLVLTTAIGFVSSCEPDTITNEQITIEQIMDIGGAGSFYVINTSTRDTIKTGSGIYIGVSYPILNAKNGDGIELNFIPADKYSNYRFNVTYTFPDSLEVESKTQGYNHSFVVKGVEPGDYSVSMSAASTEQVITSSGMVNIKITE